MYRGLRFPSAALLLALFSILLAAPRSAAQDSKVMGELKFKGASGVEKDAGVWVDGVYVGYVKELKGDKKVLLLPGKHEVTVRQSGYGDFSREVVVEPGRAAVFLDDNYIGHASEFGGALHSLSVSPGKHRIKVALPGYRTFETEVGLLAGQKSEVKTELLKGSIEQASSEVKNR